MFYVAGCLFAGWAVVLGALGLSRHDFPGSPGAERLVVVISLVLMLAAVGTGILSGIIESQEVGAEPTAALT